MDSDKLEEIIQTLYFKIMLSAYKEMCPTPTLEEGVG